MKGGKRLGRVWTGSTQVENSSDPTRHMYTPYEINRKQDTYHDGTVLGLDPELMRLRVHQVDMMTGRIPIRHVYEAKPNAESGRPQRER